VINPEKGFIVSANNLITSENVKHGISHAMVFQHRAVRITELLNQFISSGKKLNIYDMKQI
jgi:acyl-homoserine lactone acylase PvdQ